LLFFSFPLLLGKFFSTMDSKRYEHREEPADEVGDAAYNAGAIEGYDGDAHAQALWALFFRIVDSDKVAWKQLYKIASKDAEPMAKALVAVCFASSKLRTAPYSVEAARVLHEQCSTWLDLRVKSQCKYGLCLKALLCFCKVGFYADVCRPTQDEMMLKSAQEGFLGAIDLMYRLHCYDNSQVHACIEQAASTGSRRSQYAMGLMGLEDTDYVAAAFWFKKAADQRMTGAMCELAKLYLFGWGVPKSLDRAFVLLNDAGNMGRADALQVAKSWTKYAEQTMRDVDSDVARAFI
jgi:TPR repeat protein